MGSKCKEMEEKYVYKFLSSTKCFYISSWPFFSTQKKETYRKKLKITKDLSTLQRNKGELGKRTYLTAVSQFLLFSL
jgi:hypothetical protein